MISYWAYFRSTLNEHVPLWRHVCWSLSVVSTLALSLLLLSHDSPMSAVHSWPDYKWRQLTSSLKRLVPTMHFVFAEISSVRETKHSKNNKNSECFSTIFHALETCVFKMYRLFSELSKCLLYIYKSGESKHWSKVMPRPCCVRCRTRLCVREEENSGIFSSSFALGHKIVKRPGAQKTDIIFGPT